MASSLVAPALPCSDLGTSITFYEALGFTVSYRQERPNPYAVVELDDIHVHLFGIEGFKPADSYGSAIIAVADPEWLHRSFSEGLRAAFGKIPTVGIPRLLRPRSKQGTVRGFSVVDPGGNWLRIYQLGGEEGSGGTTRGLPRVVENAARVGDAKGDDEMAIAVIDRGLTRYLRAPAIERARALLYRVELAVRIGDRDGALKTLDQIDRLELSADDREAIADDLAHANEIVS